MVVGLPRPDVVTIPSDHPVVPHGASKGPTGSSFRNDRFGETNLRLRARSERRLSHLCNLRRVYPAPAICRGRTPTGSVGKHFCRVGPDRLDHGVKAQETRASATERTGRSGGLKPPGNDPRNRYGSTEIARRPLPVRPTTLRKVAGSALALLQPDHLLDRHVHRPQEQEPHLVRTAGLEPALSCKKQIFVPLRLSPPPGTGVRGLDCPFTMAISGVRCHPSSLYTFPHPGAWLGIGLGHAAR